MAEAVAAPRLIARAIGFFRRHIPTRDAVERNRYLRPVAYRILVPSLWRQHSAQPVDDGAEPRRPAA